MSVSAKRSGSSIAVDVNGGQLTEAQTRALITSLTTALNTPAFGPIPGTFTVTAPVSKKRGNNVLHGVTSIKVNTQGRIECRLTGGIAPKYASGAVHSSFSPVWGRKVMTITLAR